MLMTRKFDATGMWARDIQGHWYIVDGTLLGKGGALKTYGKDKSGKYCEGFVDTSEYVRYPRLLRASKILLKPLSVYSLMYIILFILSRLDEGAGTSMDNILWAVKAGSITLVFMLSWLYFWDKASKISVYKKMLDPPL